jgi:hypothetical protein
MNEEPAIYLVRAIHRIEDGAADSGSGSHVAGIFGKAANPFEKTVRSFTVKLIESCSLNYEMDIRPQIKEPMNGKLTLGHCVAAMREASRQRSACVSSKLPTGFTVDTWLRKLGKINNAGVALKHGDEVQQSVLLEQMKSMLGLYHVLKTDETRSLPK